MYSHSGPPTLLPAQNSKPRWLSTPTYTNLLSSHPSLLSLLRSCGPHLLPQIHAHIVVSGLSSHPYALSSLLEFSALSEPPLHDYALRLFRSSFNNPPTLFAFNLLLRAFSSFQYPTNCLMDFFNEMLFQGITPNKYTYPFVLKSLSAESGFLSLGKTVHGHAIKTGSSSDPFVHSSLINLYGVCGAIDDAQILFDRMPERNVVCWSAMVSGLVRGGRFIEALDLFRRFQVEGLEPNESILVSVLCASAHLGALQQGCWLHMYFERSSVGLSLNVGTALVDMYCKCGVVKEALEVFKKMTGRNVMSWTAMIAGLAINGMARQALDLYNDMLKAGLRPDSVTFVAVLTACSHGGLVEEAHWYFEQMTREYRIVPQVEHYGCMVDVLGRAGLLSEAFHVIESMPIEPDVVLWGALLNACCVHKNMEIGEFVGQLLIKQDPLNDANYVLLSNIYVHARRWAEAIQVRKLMKDRGIKKCPGCCVIEVNGVVHEFFVGDKWEPQFKELRPMLDEICRRLEMSGYVSDTSVVLLDIDEDVKRQTLCYHSEKLAIAFGLVKVDSTMPIRIVKNLRACIDCHSATKLISKLFDREIIVRDRQRFHHFKGGVCSCGDYW